MLVGTAERGGEGELQGDRGLSGEGGDPVEACHRVIGGRPRVVPAVRIADRHDVLEMTDSRLQSTLCAPLVEHETPPNDRHARGGRAQRLRVGHGGHTIGTHEAAYLQLRDPRCHDRLEQRHLRGRCKRGLVLQPVAQRDVT